MHQCNKERELNIILTDMREIKGDVKKLLEFKHKVLGNKAVIAIGLNYLISIAGLILIALKFIWG